jgi:hypothetical protein
MDVQVVVPATAFHTGAFVVISRSAAYAPPVPLSMITAADVAAAPSPFI